jgi:2-methylcitrate dehydratase PrpD
MDAAGWPSDQRTTTASTMGRKAFHVERPSMGSGSQEPTEALALMTSGLTLDRLPALTSARVRHIVIDAVASAFAGRDADEVRRVEAAAASSLGQGDSSVIGGGRLSPAGACFVNGYQITAVTVCDIHRPTLCHVSPEVVPPALALAEERRASGGVLLAAVAAGLETTVRVGAGLRYPVFRARGWHSAGVSGALGAAAAAARVIGLDPPGVENALGLAVAQAAGTFASYGTPTMKFNQGRAALSGLLAARFTQEGFRAPRNALTHADGGLFTTYSDGGDPRAVVDELGERWDLETIALKRWPVASSILAMATALFDLVDAHDINVADVEHLTVELPPVAYDMHGTMAWEDEFHAHLSAPYVAAVILTDHRCWLPQFSDERRADPALDALARRRVAVVLDDSLPEDAAVVHVATTSGPVRSLRRDAWRGAPADPMSEEEISAKFFEAAAGILPEPAARRAWTALSDLESVDDMAQVSALLRAPSG